MCGGVTGDILSGAGNIVGAAAAPASVFVGGGGLGAFGGAGEAASAAAAEDAFIGMSVPGATLSAGGAATAGAAAAGAAAGAAANTGSSIMGTLKSVATVLSPISSVISAASGYRSAKAMENVTAPAVPAPVTMPIYGSGQTFKSMRDQADVAATRRGRAATILTAPAGEKLGAS